MSVSSYMKVFVTVFALSVGVAVYTSVSSKGALVAQAKPAAAAVEPPIDPYDRNLTLWAHERSGAKSGWQRGREVFFMNCWMCHSEYVINGDFLPVPSLRDVGKRLTDAQITMYIQNGAGRMPAFKQLTDADIKDLLVLFKEKCAAFPTGGSCFDEHNPPPNPLYRFGTEYLAPNAVDALEAKRPGR